MTVRDETPSLYGNAIESPTGETRLGLTALVDLEPPSSGVIRPHEETVEKTVAERLGLLRTTQIDYEPILLLADDRGRLETLLAEDCAGESLTLHEDEFGNLHRLYRISDRTRLDRYRDALAGAYGLIADGHHRYRTAGLYAAERSAVRGTAPAAKLAVITSLASEALSIAPIHRGLERPLDTRSIAGAVLSRRPWSGGTGTDLARAVADSDQPSLAWLSPDGTADIWQLDPAHGPRDLPAAASRLSVVLLHRTLFPLCGLEAGAGTDGTVKYRSDPEELLRGVTGGELQTGILLPPMTASGFAGAIADGDVLPPKSTRFMPKVVSGLVWAAHSDGIE